VNGDDVSSPKGTSSHNTGKVPDSQVPIGWSGILVLFRLETPVGSRQSFLFRRIVQTALFT
jgi:hypothetical protein